MKLTTYPSFFCKHPFALCFGNARCALDHYIYYLYAIGKHNSGVFCYAFWPPGVPICVFTWTTHRYSFEEQYYQADLMITDKLWKHYFHFHNNRNGEKIVYDNVLFVGIDKNKNTTEYVEHRLSSVELAIRAILMRLSVHWSYLCTNAFREGT